MFDEIFPSPQVKQTLIIINKYGIYELPHELANEFAKLAKLAKFTGWRSLIIINKYGIYELPHEFANDLGIRILVSYEILGKCQNS